MIVEEKRGKPIRVLHVFGGLNLGGAESRTVELYRAIDREKVQFDFLVHTDARGADKKDVSSDTLMTARQAEYFDETVRALGAKIYAVPRFRGTNYPIYKKALEDFFSKYRGEWQAVHGHMTSTAAIYLSIARKNGVPLTIAHARNAGAERGAKGLLTHAMWHPLQKKDCPHLRLAVSKKAGEAVFGKDAMMRGEVRVIPNSIDTGRYAFDAGNRKAVRDSLGIGDAILLGHVGRFHAQKNHEYLIRVFAVLQNRLQSMPENERKAVKLCLVGEGERMQQTKIQAEEAGIAKDVIFAGRQKDIPAYDAAFDLMVFPSFYEGMPGVILEAQAAGLPCLISDRITEEADVTSLVKHLPITEAPEVWAEEILKKIRDMQDTGEKDRSDASRRSCEALQKAGFDIRTQAQTMTQIYFSGGKRNG